MKRYFPISALFENDIEAQELLGLNKFKIVSLVAAEDAEILDEVGEPIDGIAAFRRIIKSSDTVVARSWSKNILALCEALIEESGHAGGNFFPSHIETFRFCQRAIETWHLDTATARQYNALNERLLQSASPLAVKLIAYIGWIAFAKHMKLSARRLVDAAGDVTPFVMPSMIGTAASREPGKLHKAVAYILRTSDPKSKAALLEAIAALSPILDSNMNFLEKSQLLALLQRYFSSTELGRLSALFQIASPPGFKESPPGRTREFGQISEAPLRGSSKWLVQSLFSRGMPYFINDLEQLERMGISDLECSVVREQFDKMAYAARDSGGGLTSALSQYFVRFARTYSTWNEAGIGEHYGAIQHRRSEIRHLRQINKSRSTLIKKKMKTGDIGVSDEDGEFFVSAYQALGRIAFESNSFESLRHHMQSIALHLSLKSN